MDKLMVLEVEGGQRRGVMDGNQRVDGAGCCYGLGAFGRDFVLWWGLTGEEGTEVAPCLGWRRADGGCYLVHICRLRSFVICRVLLILFPKFSLL